MTLPLPTLMISIIKITFNNAVILDNKIQETKASFFWEFLAWLFYILSYSIGFFVGPSIIILHDVILAPTYAWKLIWQDQVSQCYEILVNTIIKTKTGIKHSKSYMNNNLTHSNGAVAP